MTVISLAISILAAAAWTCILKMVVVERWYILMPEVAQHTLLGMFRISTSEVALSSDCQMLS